MFPTREKLNKTADTSMHINLRDFIKNAEENFPWASKLFVNIRVTLSTNSQYKLLWLKEMEN